MQTVSVNFSKKNVPKNKFITVEDVKIPSPKKNEILFRTLACGICSTDIEYLINNKILKQDNKNFNGAPGKKYLGHEVVGKAVNVGKNLNKSIIGRNFVIADINICRTFNLTPTCKYCKKKQGIHCSNKAKRKYSRDVYGGYSEYFIRSYYQSIEIKKKVSPAHAAFSEPLSTAINCSNQCKISNKILIFGLGTISTLFFRVLLVKKYLKKNIFINVKNDQQKRQAKNMGFVNIINKKDFKNLKINFDKIFYFNGKIKLEEIILNYSKPLSEIIIFGHIKNIDIDPKILIKKQISLKGIHGYSSIKKKNGYISDVENAVKYIEKKKIHLNDLITQKYDLKKAEQTLTKICNDFKMGKNKTIFRSILLK